MHRRLELFVRSITHFKTLRQDWRGIARNAVLVACSTGLAAAQAPSTVRISVSTSGAQADGDSTGPAISGDGRFVAFASRAANLDSSVTVYPTGEDQVFLHDRQLGTTELVSVSVLNSQQAGNGRSYPRSLSFDGRFVSFTSSASDLVATDSNAKDDGFVYDRLAVAGNGIVLVSLDDTGVQGNNHSGQTSLSSNGRFVAFDSFATNLVPSGDANGSANDCFVHDRDFDENGTFDEVPDGVRTVRISESSTGAQATAPSEDPSISANGRFVVFTSVATNLVDPALTSEDYRVYLRDRDSDNDGLLDENGSVTTELVSVGSGSAAGNSGGSHASISIDGRFVVFDTTYDLVGYDTNGASDVYVRDLPLGQTSILSVDTSGNVSGPNSSGQASISADGRHVVFGSASATLVACDTNMVGDVFWRDRNTDADGIFDESDASLTLRISIAPYGESNELSTVRQYNISADGQDVAFHSDATNLVQGDTNGKTDVFVRHVDSGNVGKYCTAKTNSVGCVPGIAWSGVPSVSGADSFFITASQVVNNKPGIFFWGCTPAAIPFYQGTRCVASPVKRTPLQDSGGNQPPNDCSGVYSFFFSQGYMASKGLLAGNLIYGQFWTRDGGHPDGTAVGLTDAIQFVIKP